MDLSKSFAFAVACESDLQELANLINSAYRGESSRAGWTTEADLLEGQRTNSQILSSELAAGSHRTVLCLRENSTGELNGCVFLERFEDEVGAGCYLGMLTVKPTLQAQGLGKFILQYAESYAKKWGATRVTLGVIHLRESLMAWYERHGYHKTGKTKPFPYGQPETGIPQRDDLHFILFEKRI